MLITDWQQWSVSAHAVDRYLERINSSLEESKAARSRIVNLLATDLLFLGHPTDLDDETRTVPYLMKVCCNPPHGPILVLNSRQRCVVTCYLPDQIDQRLIRRKMHSRKDVEDKLQKYRYCYMARTARWPNWLGKARV